MPPTSKTNVIKVKCISQYYIELQKDIEVNFTYENCAVDTITNIPESKEENENSFKFLRLSIEFELKQYESISDGPIYSRPKYLSLLGILSFLLDTPFDVFGPFANTYVHPDGLSGINIPKERRLRIEEIDLTEHLVNLIDSIERSSNHEKNLIFSLLDRWRKGRYLEEENEQSFLFDDEATLSYFHVLELLGDVFLKELKVKSTSLVDSFVETFNREILSLEGSALECESLAKSKLLSNLLNKDISTSAKILHFFKESHIYSNETANWIKSLIEARNNVAHGRKVHYEKAIFPVLPFFPLNKIHIYPLEFLRVLTAKAICCYLNLSLYNGVWEEVESVLISDVTCTKKFIETESFKPIEDSSDKQRKIICGGINHYVLSRIIKPRACTNFLDFYLDVEGANTEFLASNIEAIVMHYESTDNPNTEAKLEKAIIKIHELDCNPYSKFRDLKYFLDFNNFYTPKLEALIISKQVK